MIKNCSKISIDSESNWSTFSRLLLNKNRELPPPPKSGRKPSAKLVDAIYWFTNSAELISNLIIIFSCRQTFSRQERKMAKYKILPLRVSGLKDLPIACKTSCYFTPFTKVCYQINYKHCILWNWSHDEVQTMAHVIPTSENAHVGGRITVHLVSSLTKLELTEKENLLLFVSISLIPDL